MEKAIENICIEFSNSYLTSSTDHEDLLSLKVSVMDISDLRRILKAHGFVLESISLVGFRKALVIFSKAKIQ